MSNACPTCGRIVYEPNERYCAEHRRAKSASWSQGRDRQAQARFRERLVHEYGGQCGAVVDGVRCPETLASARAKGEPLQAHHTRPGDDTQGVLLCRLHHKQADPRAR